MLSLQKAIVKPFRVVLGSYHDRDWSWLEMAGVGGGVGGDTIEGATGKEGLRIGHR